MAKAKTKPKAGKKLKVERIEKAELFAYSYIKHAGNGTAAVKDVYGLDNDASANTRAYELLRNAEVQKIIGEYLEAQRESFKKMVDRGAYYMNAIAETLLEIMKDPKTSIHERFKAMDKLSRLAGADLSEEIKLKQIEARVSGEVARARAELPGLPAPGIQPGAPLSTGNVDNSRKTIFMLMPPPMPQGGVPTPALESQWREMGWQPGVAGAPAPEDTAIHDV